MLRDTSTLSWEGPGIDLVATIQLPVNPLFLLSYCPQTNVKASFLENVLSSHFMELYADAR